MAPTTGKCPALSSAPLPRPLPRARRRRDCLRCRCCEDTLGVPLRRAQHQHQHQLLQFPELTARPYNGGLVVPPPAAPAAADRAGAARGERGQRRRGRLPAHRPHRQGLARRGGLRPPLTAAGLLRRGRRGGYVSPYRRTLETLRGIGRAFEPRRIAGVREEPRLREQDFGSFQDREKMRVEKEIRRRYGRFFYRFPNGESAADVYDRITGFRETLPADIDIGRFQPPKQRSPNMDIVLVSHGLTLRVFLMRWCKWTVRQFEGLSNLDNGGALVMQTGDGGRYSLLVHHTADELRAFGLTDEMLQDQMWHKTAKPGELNYNFMKNGQSFFD